MKHHNLTFGIPNNRTIENQLFAKTRHTTVEVPLCYVTNWMIYGLWNGMHRRIFIQSSLFQLLFVTFTWQEMKSLPYLITVTILWTSFVSHCHFHCLWWPSHHFVSKRETGSHRMIAHWWRLSSVVVMFLKPKSENVWWRAKLHLVTFRQFSWYRIEYSLGRGS